MKKKFGSALLALIMLIFSVPHGLAADDSSFAQWKPWSFYATAGYYPLKDNPTGSGWDFGDTNNSEYFVPVTPIYRSTNNVQPGLMVRAGEDKPYFYIRPEYEWDVKIEEHVKERTAFYLTESEKSDVNLSEIVIGFTAPADGIYNIYGNVINDYGNDKAPEGVAGDGGIARVSVLTEGETKETTQNSEEFNLPAAGKDALQEVVYEKNEIKLSKNDKIYFRVSAGENTDGDVFQAIWRINQLDDKGAVLKCYDLRDLVDNAEGAAVEGVQNVIDKSVVPHNEEEESQSKEEKNARLLAQLGIIESSEIGSYLLNKEITRAEFAKLFSRVLNYEDLAKTSESKYYTDVKSQHNPSIIDKLAEERIIVKSRLFRPDEVITLNEAIKIAVTALGYEKYAEAYGGFPGGYLKQANILDIIPNQTKGNLMRWQAVDLVYNMLDVYMLEFDSLTGEEIVINNYKKETILNKKHKIYYSEGVVTKIPYGSPEKGTTGFGKMAEIDGTEYKTDLNLNDMLGLRVEFYYRDDDGEYALLYVIPEKKSQRLELDAENIYDISDSEISYMSEKKTKKYRISPQADFLYNGKAGGITEDLSHYVNRDSKVFILDRDGDGVFDVMDIRTYKNYLVDYVNKNEVEIIDKTSQKSIFLDEAHSTVFQYADGSSAEFSEIEKDDVLSIYETHDKSVMRVVINRKTIIGTITQTNHDEKYYRYTIEGKEYRVAENYSQICVGEIQLGCETTVYLDAFGHIAYVKPNFASRFGYLMKVSNEVADLHELQFKITTSSGEIVNYHGSSKIIYNGLPVEREKLYDIILAEYGEENYKGIILYKAAAGAIKEITMQSDLSTSYYEESLKYHNATGILNGKIVVDENTLLFRIPDEIGKARGILPKVEKAKSYFVHFASYAGLTSVKLNKNQIVSDVILVSGSKAKALDNYQYPLLVKSISDFFDENEEIRQKVTGYRNGELLTYYTESEVTFKGVSAYASTSPDKYDIDVGDVILTTLDGDVITYAQIDFDASEKKKLGPNPYSDYFGRPHLYYASVYSKQGQFLRITQEPKPDTDPSTLEIQGINKIYVIDLSLGKDKVKEGSYADIIPYKSNDSSATGYNENYTRAVFSTMEKPDAIYIYK